MPCRLNWRAFSHPISQIRSEGAKAAHDAPHIFVDGAFPDNLDAPACTAQFFLGNAVTYNIAVELGVPELTIGGRPSRTATAMSVPETAMYEDGCSIAREDNIGLARHLPIVKPIPKASGMNGLTHVEF